MIFLNIRPHEFDRFFLLFYKYLRIIFEQMAAVRECNFRTGRIPGKHFPEALVHTVHRTSAAGRSASGKRFPGILPLRKLDISLWQMYKNFTQSHLVKILEIIHARGKHILVPIVTKFSIEKLDRYFF